MLLVPIVSAQEVKEGCLTGRSAATAAARISDLTGDVIHVDVHVRIHQDRHGDTEVRGVDVGRRPSQMPQPIVPDELVVVKAVL